jgi:hypothetical protein
VGGFLLLSLLDPVKQRTACAIVRKASDLCRSIAPQSQCLLAWANGNGHGMRLVIERKNQVKQTNGFCRHLTVSTPTRGRLNNCLCDSLREYNKHPSFMFWCRGVICNQVFFSFLHGARSTTNNSSLLYPVTIPGRNQRQSEPQPDAHPHGDQD